MVFITTNLILLTKILNSLSIWNGKTNVSEKEDFLLWKFAIMIFINFEEKKNKDTFLLTLLKMKLFVSLIDLKIQSFNDIYSINFEKYFDNL